MLRPVLLGLALLATTATPLAAQDSPDGALLEQRLRACLSTSAAGSPRDSLSRAVVALRARCYTQIRRVREFRLAVVDRSFGLPGARLSTSRREELERARDAATRRLNDEIVRAVANFTGLTL